MASIDKPWQLVEWVEATVPLAVPRMIQGGPETDWFFARLQAGASFRAGCWGRLCGRVVEKPELVWVVTNWFPHHHYKQYKESEYGGSVERFLASLDERAQEDRREPCLYTMKGMNNFIMHFQTAYCEVVTAYFPASLSAENERRAMRCLPYFRIVQTEKPWEEKSATGQREWIREPVTYKGQPARALRYMFRWRDEAVEKEYKRTQYKEDEDGNDILQVDYFESELKAAAPDNFRDLAAMTEFVHPKGGPPPRVIEWLETTLPPDVPPLVEGEHLPKWFIRRLAAGVKRDPHISGGRFFVRAEEMPERAWMVTEWKSQDAYEKHKASIYGGSAERFLASLTGGKDEQRAEATVTTMNTYESIGPVFWAARSEVLTFYFPAPLSAEAERMAYKLPRPFLWTLGCNTWKSTTPVSLMSWIKEPVKYEGRKTYALRIVLHWQSPEAEKQFKHTEYIEDAQGNNRLKFDHLEAQMREAGMLGMESLQCNFSYPIRENGPI